MAKHRTPARRAQKGETLAEVLVALLVVALAALLLASMVTASNSVNIAARNRDEALYKALQTVEAAAAAGPSATESKVAIYKVTGGTVAATPDNTYDVYVYTQDNITLYKYKQP